MQYKPSVDINIFAFNNCDTIGAVIESFINQTWKNIKLNIIDNGSEDNTLEISRMYEKEYGNCKVISNGVNTGAVLNCQRAFWLGESEFVLPKTGDDLIAPEFVERIMEIILDDAGCAMCHAAGVIFTDSGEVRHLYPLSHCLNAMEFEAGDRARNVMRHYTSAPSFWGIYRRIVVNRLSRLPFEAGWDHAVLAEVSLYGSIRSITEPLYWRCNGGKPVDYLATNCSEFYQRGLSTSGLVANVRWMTPLITTAYCHIEIFARARLSEAERMQLMDDVPQIFQNRWRPLMNKEVEKLRGELPIMINRIISGPRSVVKWRCRQIMDVLEAVEIILPGEKFYEDRNYIARKYHSV
jgi:glycosyltransferase involved in cell wall biosynthesis